MNCLAWNCRGLGGSSAIHNLELHIRDHYPQIIFLSETKCTGRKIESLKRKLNFDGVCVDARGNSGGLALLWSKDMVVDLKSFSVNHIDVFVYGDDIPDGWRFTGFYGEPNPSRRNFSWNLLRQLSRYSQKPWVCMGDFNELLSQSEKHGGNAKPAYQLRDFRSALLDSGLSDIGFSGQPFTWTNGWAYPYTIYERLDRVCVSDSWIQKFPASKVNHLRFGGSDHIPILLQIRVQDLEQPCRKKRFMFEAMWLESNECAKVIQDSWSTHSDTTNALGKLGKCKASLTTWSRSSFGNVKRQIEQLRNNIDTLRKGVISESTRKEEIRINLELEKVLDREEKMWQQRAKAHWMREGDRNTRYFHVRASGRKKKNNISGIKKENGQWCHSEIEIEREVVDYFRTIFTSAHPSEEDLDVVLSGIGPRVSSEDNQHLLQPYTADEVYRALNSMHPLKSPGPDGFPPLFFQKFWSNIGSDITKWVLDFLNHGIFDEKSNYTNIVLIPKCPSPESMSQFRPISLCNVIYKIASKTIANRLKPIMNTVISDYQSAFVPGRQITDNVLVAFETTHYMKTLTKGDVGQMAIKLDMSKAYDRVEWEFLRATMIRLGFDESFVRLIMRCVTTVSYSFVLNGSQIGFIKPERGIRQGDPLSPYLFLFCAESLSSLIWQKEMDGVLRGIAVCEGAPQISHLLFADDTLILCQASDSAALCIQELLHLYGIASGQNINFQKSSIVFTKNTPTHTIDSILSTLPIRHEEQHDKYLGLPLIVGKSKRDIFGFIRERVWNRVKSLRVRSLSKAGREILIKSVLQGIPSYLMSCFKLPGFLIKEIESMVANFWWDEKERRKIHWVNWNSLCNSKRDGGMGFRDLDSFNTALLAKQAWRILTNPHALLSRILKAKYFPTCDIFNAALGSRPSLTWRSILGSINTLVSGIRWRIGDGRKVQIWGDSWLPRSGAFKVTSPTNLLPPYATVSDLIDENLNSWNKELIEEIFWEEEAKLILSIPLGNRNSGDGLMWHFEKSGLFSVKTAYRLHRDIKASLREAVIGGPSSRTTRDWNWIWRISIPPKVRSFIWSCCSRSLPVRDRLKQRKIVDDNTCPRCGLESETIIHCLLKCSYARQVWAMSNIPFSVYNSDLLDVEQWFLEVRSKTDSSDFSRFSILCWWIWFSRNKFLWEESTLQPHTLCFYAADFYSRFQASLIRYSQQVVNRSLTRWKSPPPNFVKVNMDAAVNGDNNTIGIGVIVRDSIGNCLGWRGITVNLPLDPEAAEALAALRAIEFCHFSGWQNVILEGDCSSVINGIVAKEVSRGSLGHIFEDIKLLAKDFLLFQAAHVVRECNKAAHSLAKLASSNFLFSSVLPISVLDIVIADSL